MHPINEFGSNSQKEKYLPRLAKGELLGAFVRNAFLRPFPLTGFNTRVSQNQIMVQILLAWRLRRKK